MEHLLNFYFKKSTITNLFLDWLYPTYDKGVPETEVVQNRQFIPTRLSCTVFEL